MISRRDFLIKLSENNPTRFEQAVALLWFYNQTQAFEERTISDLAGDLLDDGFGKPNVTRLRNKFIKSKLVVRGSRPDTFRINAAQFSKLSQKYGPLVNLVQVDVTPSVIPIEFVQGTRIYLEKMVNQINGCYNSGFYDACAVMIRRLMESLIIEVFFYHNKASEIKVDNVIVSLDTLIRKIVNDNQIHLSRNAPSQMGLIKDLGDTAAHDRTYITQRDDIDDNRNKIRRLLQELLSLSGIKK